jgi:nucleoside 2-deoxyribosyltransferase
MGRGNLETPKRREPEGSRVLIYLAGLLFSEAERRFNPELAEKLEALGFRVFLPQCDGVERERPPYDAMAPDERRHAMFHLDKQEILDSNVFLFVLDGRVPDEGACVGLGIAHCQQHLQNSEKLLIGLHADARAASDARAALVGSRLNPTVRVPLNYMVDDEETLLRVLTEHGSGTEADTE